MVLWDDIKAMNYLIMEHIKYSYEVSWVLTLVQFGFLSSVSEAVGSFINSYDDLPSHPAL